MLPKFVPNLRFADLMKVVPIEKSVSQEFTSDGVSLLIMGVF